MWQQDLPTQVWGPPDSALQLTSVLSGLECWSPKAPGRWTSRYTRYLFHFTSKEQDSTQPWCTINREHSPDSWLHLLRILQQEKRVLTRCLRGSEWVAATQSSSLAECKELLGRVFSSHASLSAVTFQVWGAEWWNVWPAFIPNFFFWGRVLLEFCKLRHPRRGQRLWNTQTCWNQRKVYK